jgi:hypothetical protein
MQVTNYGMWQHSHGIQLMKLNETIVESLKSKESQKCSKTMVNKMPIDK